MMNTDFYGERGQAIATAARAYEELTCRTFSRLVLDDIGWYIDRGAQAALIVKAIEITAVKGLDWRYTKGILNRCMDEGIFTAEAYDYRLIFKKTMHEFKSEYPNCEESMLFPFVVIETGRQTGYLEKIRQDLAALE